MKNIIQKILLVVRTRGVIALVRASLRIALRVFLLNILKKRYVNTAVFDFKLRIDLKDKGISRTLWLYGERELDHKWMLEEVVWSGARILDVGANIGYYAVMESLLVGEKGQILALEPSPENYRTLEKNILLNRAENVSLECVAVSNKTEQKTFFLAEESNLNTFYEPILAKRGNLAGSVLVQTYSLSDIIAKYGSFDFLRMDIEGHEVFVLEEIATLAKAGKKCPSVIFESHINAYGPDQDIKPVLRALEDGGFHVSIVASSNERGTEKLIRMGHEPVRTIVTDETVRTIHRDLQFSELIECITNTGGIRTIFLQAPGA